MLTHTFLSNHASTNKGRCPFISNVNPYETPVQVGSEGPNALVVLPLHDDVTIVKFLNVIKMLT